MGACGSTLNVLWFNGVLPTVFPGTSIPVVLAKVLVTNTLGSAVCNTLIFGGMYFMEGDSRSGVSSRLQKVVPGIVKLSLMFWGPVQTTMFIWVPASFHVPILSTVGFFFSTYLSCAANSQSNVEEMVVNAEG
eukprot:NODE_5012_length_731_cov_11.841642_g4654_i0.p1 GENE.NODE_5012_length_731_cov_11.841642_g4654_i0~~NODE_5012_length_731_cov_11.841642_g4654_i0.p1  ORF type:complete len:142 (+),score=22.15 NODE_5012_length_731_cov_11.841642_g4654_i0:29-427(+)